MQLMAAYRFIFWNPKWPTIILIGCLSMLVPVVGIIVFIGYLFEVIEFYHRQSEEEKIPTVQPADGAFQLRRTAAPEDVRQRAYPDFNFSRLSDYLMRGLWPALLNLVASLPITFAIIALFFVCIFLVQIAVVNKAGGLVIGLIIGVTIFAYFAVILTWSIVHVPMYLRAGLARDFASAFSFGFLKDFMGRVGKELVVAQLFLFVGGLILTMIGMLACWVGLYPATIIAFMASHYMDYQLYELYLERGGKAILPAR
jgi:hypothetical protein